MKRSGFAPRAQTLKRTAWKVSTKPSKRMKSKGMVGRAPTADEERFMCRVASIGCIACLLDGRTNPWGSIHHIDGRTKPGAHYLVLFLCAGHHKDGEGEDKTLIAVHPYKARFEARYGTQYELLEIVKSKLSKEKI